MARTNKANLSKQGDFKHGTSIGENGDILYDMPIEVKDDQDLRNYGITESDCRFLPFGSSKKVKVFFFKTPDRSFAEAEWERLNTEHSTQYFATRCMVPGKRKAFVKCRDTNKCSACPYGIKPADKQSQVISWNKLVDSGWEPVPGESVENQVLAKIEYGLLEGIRGETHKESLRRMDEIDQKLEELVEQQQTLTTIMTQGYLEPAVFTQERNDLDAKTDALTAEKDRLMKRISGNLSKTDALNDLIHYVAHADPSEDFEAELVIRFLDHATICSRDEVVFHLKCGLALTERIGEK